MTLDQIKYSAMCRQSFYIFFMIYKERNRVTSITENPKCKKTDIVSFVPVVSEVSSFVVNPV